MQCSGYFHPRFSNLLSCWFFVLSINPNHSVTVLIQRSWEQTSYHPAWPHPALMIMKQNNAQILQIALVGCDSNLLDIWATLASVPPGSFQNSSDCVVFISPGNIAKYKLLFPFSYLSAFQMPGKSTNQCTNLCHLLGVIYHHQKKWIF